MASMHDSVRFETTVYAAIELSKKSWVVAIAHPDRDRPSIHRIAGGNVADLIGRLRKAAGKNRRIVVCYEAGYDGFWLARSLAKIGIDCRVLDPASIQVNRRARRVKTDRIDALALLRAVIAIDRGERHVCRGPSTKRRGRRCAPLPSGTPAVGSGAHRPYQPYQGITLRSSFAALITAEARHLPQRLRQELQ